MAAPGIAGSCADELDGYLARLPPNRGNQRAVEHNIDIYALAGAPLSHQKVIKRGKNPGKNPYRIKHFPHLPAMFDDTTG